MKLANFMPRRLMQNRTVEVEVIGLQRHPITLSPRELFVKSAREQAYRTLVSSGKSATELTEEEIGVIGGVALGIADYERDRLAPGERAAVMADLEAGRAALDARVASFDGKQPDTDFVAKRSRYNDLVRKAIAIRQKHPFAFDENEQENDPSLYPAIGRSPPSGW